MLKLLLAAGVRAPSRPGPRRALSAAAGASAQAAEKPVTPAPTQAPPRPETTWASVVVGEIVRLEAHPAADRLRVCHVDVGDRAALLQIVCGAPNAAAGARVAVAKVGTKLAIADPESGDVKLLKIKKSKLRGELSQGMICSEAELGLAAHSDGILILDATAPVGSLVREWRAVAARLDTPKHSEAKADEPKDCDPKDGDYRCHI